MLWLLLSFAQASETEVLYEDPMVPMERAPPGLQQPPPGLETRSPDGGKSPFSCRRELGDEGGPPDCIDPGINDGVIWIFGDAFEEFGRIMVITGTPVAGLSANTEYWVFKDPASWPSSGPLFLDVVPINWTSGSPDNDTKNAMNAFCTMWQSPANSAWTLARPEGYTRGPVQQSFSSAGPPGLPTLAGAGAVSINVPSGSRLLRFFATNTLEDYLEVDPGPGGTGARVNWYTAYTGTDPGAPFSNIQADQTYAVDDLTPMSGAGGLYRFHPRYKVHVENSTPGLGFMTCPLFTTLAL